VPFLVEGSSFQPMRTVNQRAILGIDAICVVAFAIIGRQNHQSESGSVVETAAPFLVGLVIGWILSRAWRAPTAWRTGLITVAATIVFGLILRKVWFSGGTAFSFALVAASVLSALLLGWRVVATRLLQPGTAHQ